MTFHKSAVILSLALIFSAIVVGCSTLPRIPTTDVEMYDELTGPQGPQYLKEISIAEWPDRGQEIARRLTWIGTQANLLNVSDEAHRAGQAAHALARFLSKEHGSLRDIPSGWFKLQHKTIGALNPQLVNGYAAALIPYQHVMVGDIDPRKAYDQSAATNPLDLAEARNVFALINTSTEGHQKFVDAANKSVHEYLQRSAQAFAKDRSTSALALRHAALLAGLVKGGQQQENVESNDAETSQYWITWAGYELAIALGARPDDPGLTPAYFNDDATLRSPDDIDHAQFSTYVTALQLYTSGVGADTLGVDFDRWYDEAAGK
jgi:hypothetical protein